MNVKVHYLHSHLNHFLENLEGQREEPSEWFQPNFKTMEGKYREDWDIYMMADYFSSIERDCLETSHRKKSLKHYFWEITK